MPLWLQEVIYIVQGSCIRLCNWERTLKLEFETNEEIEFALEEIPNLLQRARPLPSPGMLTIASHRFAIANMQFGMCWFLS